MKSYKILIWLMSVALMLFVLSLIFPTDGLQIGKTHLRFEHITLPSPDSLLVQFKSPQPQPFDSAAYIDSLKIAQARQDSTIKAEQQQLQQTIYSQAFKQLSAPIIFPLGEDSLPNYNYFNHLFDALNNADSIAVNIVHYGDSQIEEDRITLTLRRLLQQQFGGMGAGSLSTYPLIGSRTMAQTTTPEPTRYALWGKKSLRRTTSNQYGPIGHTAELNGNTISVSLVPRQQKRGIYSAQQFTRFTLFTQPADTIYISFNEQTHNIITKHQLLQANTFLLPDTTSKLQLTISGKGDVYAIRLHHATGITIDNFAMRGSSGTVFTQNNAEQLKEYFSQTNTQLIILQFGGNSMPFTKTTKGIDNYVSRLVEQVQFMHEQAPQAAILFIGPSDMPTRINGKMQTYPMISYFEQQMSKAMQNVGCAYWSMFKAMGGEGSMLSWVQQGLAANDYIHFSGNGAEIIGNKLYDAIFAAYQAYQQNKQQLTTNNITQQSADD